jgi:hypothetical protein
MGLIHVPHGQKRAFEMMLQPGLGLPSAPNTYSDVDLWLISCHVCGRSSRAPSRNFATAPNAAKNPINVIMGDDVKCFTVFVRLGIAKLDDRSDPFNPGCAPRCSGRHTGRS